MLGSLPGRASLDALQYYAQPRNAFWRIMGAQFGAGPELPYRERLQRLSDAGVALWDVCHSARRPGSLDADIDLRSVTPNDFASLFQRCRGIERVGLNGAAAARLYAQLVLPALPPRWQHLPRVALPSTSPAHAAMPLAEKQARWSAFLEID